MLVSFEKIILIDRESSEARIVDSLPPDTGQGALNGVRFSPSSDKFVYEKSMWSSFSSSRKVFVYIINTLEKKEIYSVPQRVFSLFWDKSGENLYSLDVKVKDLSVYAYPFEIKIFQIPLDDLSLRVIGNVIVEKKDTPLDHLSARGIELFMDADMFSFKRDEAKTQLEKNSQVKLFIDNHDFLNFQSGPLEFVRLLKIPRQPDLLQPQKYQYKGGALTFESVRWVGESNYVLIVDKNEGGLLLEPAVGICGRLMADKADVFGWAPDI